MKTFKAYLNEANYTRFLKQNKNLSPEQVKKLNDYFSKENRQAGAEIDWQTMKIATMTYNDFENIIIGYKSGFIKEMKVNIPGKKGEDYWKVNLNNKKFLAYIPLNYETAKFLNSKKYGTVATGHCIGWGKGDGYWKEHVLKEHKVPIYVIDGSGKWVVMIKESNNNFEVWNKANQRDSAKDKDTIPGFDITKEFLSSGLKKMYNKLRKDVFIIDHFIYDAKISSDAEYDIKNNYLTWYNGTWKFGTWDDGTWEIGTWIYGVWKGGTWERGTWKGGFWEKGTWKYGTWEKGTWENGDWLFGIWKFGTWEWGIWKDGFWEDGTWMQGLWENGIWENGIWEGGTWEKGTWEGGYDKDGNYHKAGDSPNKW